MICPNCQQPTGRIKAFLNEEGEMVEFCSACLGISEVGGTRVDGLLTRNSLRIRSMATKFEGDTIPPHTFNKSSRKMEPNPEFIKQFGKTAEQFYSESEVTKAGMPKLAEHYRKVRKNKAGDKKVTFEGNAKKGIKRVIS